MSDQSGFILILVLGIVTTALVMALFLRPEWFDLQDEPKEDKRHGR